MLNKCEVEKEKLKLMKSTKHSNYLLIAVTVIYCLMV